MLAARQNAPGHLPDAEVAWPVPRAARPGPLAWHMDVLPKATLPCAHGPSRAASSMLP